MDPSTQQFFFFSSDVIVSRINYVLLIRLTAIAVKQTACDSTPLSAA
jgi:hypothetical protein